MCRGHWLSSLSERHLGRALHEIQALDARIDREARDAGRPAALSGDVGDLARDHLVIGLFHLFDGPGPQDRIGEIRNPVGRLPLAIGNIGMVLDGHHGPGPAGGREEIIAGGAVGDPGGAGVGGEIGHRRTLRGERGRTRAAGANKSCQHCPGQQRRSIRRFGHRILSRCFSRLCSRRVWTATFGSRMSGQVSPPTCCMSGATYPNRWQASVRVRTWSERPACSRCPALRRSGRARRAPQVRIMRYGRRTPATEDRSRWGSPQT